jgi:prolyl-tRNA synthetase
MILPPSLAPFHVYLASLNVDDPEVVAAAESLYDELQQRGIEVLYDDRDEKPGVKFNDADLIGLPLRVVVSRRGLANGEAELKGRRDESPSHAPLADAADAIEKALGE